MREGVGIQRVIIVVLDGLRPDAIDQFDLTHLRRLIRGGASSLSATTIAPSVTAAAMTSLLTGVSPAEHGQRRGLILLHWPDADRAGHASGWMSAAAWALGLTPPPSYEGRVLEELFGVFVGRDAVATAAGAVA